MVKKFIIVLIIVIFLSTTNYNKVSNKINKTVSRNKIKYNYIEQKEEAIGTIFIEKIKVNNKLYDIKDPNNNVDKNVTILYKDNNTIVLAAHSGTEKVSYFKNLNKLKANDEVIVNINNKIDRYIVEEIWEEEKNGTINFKKEEKEQLILTTCSPDNKKRQLIVSCTKKEP